MSNPSSTPPMLPALLIAAACGASPADAADPSSQDVRGTVVLRHGASPSMKGAAETFTGDVRVEARFQREAPSRVSGATVTFAPGARTAWHTHPLGQTLVVTSGKGWTQTEGGPVVELAPGDIVWCPPDVRHWHGATPTTSMTHVAIAEALDGEVVTWMEHVGDAEYARGPAPTGTP